MGAVNTRHHHCGRRGGGGRLGACGARTVCGGRWFGFEFSHPRYYALFGANFGPRAQLPGPHNGISYHPTHGHCPDISRSTRLAAEEPAFRSLCEFTQTQHTTPDTQAQTHRQNTRPPPHTMPQRQGERLAAPGRSVVPQIARAHDYVFFRRVWEMLSTPPWCHARRARVGGASGE